MNVPVVLLLRARGPSRLPECPSLRAVTPTPKGHPDKGLIARSSALACSPEGQGGVGWWRPGLSPGRDSYNRATINHPAWSSGAN